MEVSQHFLLNYADDTHHDTWSCGFLKITSKDTDDLDFYKLHGACNVFRQMMNKDDEEWTMTTLVKKKKKMMMIEKSCASVQKNPFFDTVTCCHIL